MKAASHPTAKSSLQTEIGQLMQAEQQVSRILPQILQSMWSTELSRTLRQALAVSETHQLALTRHCHAQPAAQAAVVTELENRIILALQSGHKGIGNDLILTHLAAEIIEHKLNCYEILLGSNGQEGFENPARMLGAAISDEAATGLFLQELAERFESRQLS